MLSIVYFVFLISCSALAESENEALSVWWEPEMPSHSENVHSLTDGYGNDLSRKRPNIIFCCVCQEAIRRAKTAVNQKITKQLCLRAHISKTKKEEKKTRLECSYRTMYLACIVGSFVILFAATESSPYEASRETVQTITFYDNKEDLCNAKMAIKCCICLKMIKTYIPIIYALINKNVRSVCNANKFLRIKFLVECSSTTNKAHWKSMLESNELNFPEEDKNSRELNIESDMNVITCWVCKKSIHEIKGIILHEIKKVYLV
ncbi:unnamed protein product [Leuciscus chuanchicus]